MKAGPKRSLISGLRDLTEKFSGGMCVARELRVAAEVGWPLPTSEARDRRDRLCVTSRTSALAQDAPDDETDIRRPLAEPAHEVGEPFTAEWNVDADAPPFAFERAL